MTQTPARALVIRWGPLAVAAVAAVLCGMRLWFLCDDAFISFRYCGNAFDGHGLVWNPAPFAPVEGYTNFGWVAWLYLTWIATGIDPTRTATVFTFACGLVVLWLLDRRLATAAPADAVGRGQSLVAVAVLLAVATNHTFATWLSSGLETAAFALFAVLWTLRATRRDGERGAGLVLLGVFAAAAYLIRPDGMLLVLGTVLIGAHGWWTGRGGRRTLAALAPAVLVPAAHFLWRRAYYGEWVPNTYHAKVTAAWPESGLRYLFCFVLEHGLWLWLLLAVLWLVTSACRRGAAAALFGARFPALVAVGAWVAFTGYYTLVVGGDHFAWRVFAHFVPLVFLSAALMTASLGARAGVTAGVVALLGVVGNVPGWWLEAQLAGRELEPFVRTATRAPAPLRPLLRHYDRNQAWLLLHSVGFRRAFHDAACRIARHALPERRAGLVAGGVPGQRLVYRADAIGVTGWALADVAILDGHGLCDWVVARTPKPPAEGADPDELRAAFPALDGDADGRLDAAEIAAASHLLGSIGPQVGPATWSELMLSLGDHDGDDRLDADELVRAITAVVPPRQMAHERAPPEGYIEAFRPNVGVVDGRLAVLPDVVPLTDDEIRAVEQRWRAMAGR